jgi:hypothetical protein
MFVTNPATIRYKPIGKLSFQPIRLQRQEANLLLHLILFLLPGSSVVQDCS